MAKNGKKVIIVDDDEDLLQILSYGLESKGYEVKTFKTGKDALHFLLVEKNIQNASLLVLDRILPDMDGLDILKKFVKKYQKPIPILILSVLSAEKDILAGLKEGAFDYMAKPFSLTVFMQKANDLITRGKK